MVFVCGIRDGVCVLNKGWCLCVCGIRDGVCVWNKGWCVCVE